MARADEPAFPSPERVIPEPHGAFANDRHFAGYCGMTMREWYAGQALSGVLGMLKPGAPWAAMDIAVDVFTIADAMIALAEKK